MRLHKLILSQLFYRIKLFNKHVRFGISSYIPRNSNFEGYNSIGSHCFYYGNMGYASYIGDETQITGDIGRYTSIGERVRTLPHSHPVNQFVSTHPAFYSIKKQSGFSFVKEQKYVEERFYDKDRQLAVNIGHDVWIGSDAIILGGVKIGNGAVVAAGAVVTKDVEPYAIVGGVPAKFIRYRFTAEQREKLIEFEWWEKDIEWLSENAEKFSDIEQFVLSMNRGKL